MKSRKNQIFHFLDLILQLVIYHSIRQKHLFVDKIEILTNFVSLFIKKQNNNLGLLLEKKKC